MTFYPYTAIIRIEDIIQDLQFLEVIYMKMVDVVSITQAGLNQLIGQGYFPIDTNVDTSSTPAVLTDNDSALLVDMGEVAKGSTLAGDLVFKTMIDQLGKLIIDSRAYVPSLPKLFIDPIEWGGFVEHVRVGLSDVQEVDEMWNPLGFINYKNAAYTDSDGNSYPAGTTYASTIAQKEHGFYRPKVNAKIYKEAKPIMVALSTAREQLFSAFKSWDEMNRFLSALYTSVENTLSYKAQLFALMTLSTGIGTAVALGHEIPLRTMWNATHSATLSSVDEALEHNDFIAYALSQMAETTDNMTMFSTAFNNGVEPVFTPKEDNRLILLSKFANIAKFGVRANTYNEELLGIGDFDRVTAWQAINAGADNFDFSAVSTIRLSAASVTKLGLTPDTGETYATISNIVGLMYDRYALGVTLDKKKVTQNYIAVNDTWNSFYHSLVNYVCNPDYNIAVFTLN